MILEHALLPVRPGTAADFERAFRQALPLISATPGFGGLELRRSVETPDHYLLLVRWDSVEAHTEAFRGSSRYPAWRELLHRFYDPFPVVEHFTPVLDIGPHGAGSAER